MLPFPGHLLVKLHLIFLLGRMASGNDDDELSLIHNGSKERQKESASSKRSTLVVLCILFVELCERLTFYGVTANLVFYCKDVLKLASPLPSTIALAFQGTMIS